jgi:serine/threonine protein kinase
MMETKKFLGYGGFAIVNLVTRKSDNVLIALKQSQRPIYAMRPEEQKAFKREVDAMKKLDHPFIVKLYESFEQNEHYFLATQYADGGSLDKYLEAQKDKKMPVE